LLKKRRKARREPALAHQVFVSHAVKDADTASSVCAMLEAEGVSCWLPARDAAASKNKAAANLQAIRDSELVLLIFSASANASSTVLRDIERAVAKDRPVLSIHLDDAVPNASLEYLLNLWQWLDASRGLEAKRGDIVAAVKEQLAESSEPFTWRWLDAPLGVESRREEIVAAVRAQLPSRGESTPRWWLFSRRTWIIAIAATTVAVALALGLGLGLGLGEEGDEGPWTRLDPAGPPDHAPTAPMVYDSVSHRLFLLTPSIDDDSYISPVEVWAYDPAANTWTEIKPTGDTPPPARSDFAMNYDPETQQLIVFGGTSYPSTMASDGDWVNYPTASTWAFDTVSHTWKELKPLGTWPPARLEGATAYDPVSKRLILFGGVGEQAALGDTWAYNPAINTWQELKPEGSPPARSTKMVYDPVTKRMLIFGGPDPEGKLSNDLWAYDPAANTWTELKPGGTLPPKRMGFGIAYDDSRRQIIMFGGQNNEGTRFFNDSWAYDPVANTWSEIVSLGRLPRACISSIVYDLATERLIMLAQGGPNVTLNDIWAFNP
jgi:TIR domain/Galactose oxidase, central domain